jgi:hypothetical protein
MFATSICQRCFIQHDTNYLLNQIVILILSLFLLTMRYNPMLSVEGPRRIHTWVF